MFKLRLGKTHYSLWTKLRLRLPNPCQLLGSLHRGPYEAFGYISWSLLAAGVLGLPWCFPFCPGLAGEDDLGGGWSHQARRWRSDVGSGGALQPPVEGWEDILITRLYHTTNLSHH